MKKTITILFFLFTILLSCGQNQIPKDKFQKDIQTFSEAYSKKDWEKYTSMIYPKLFDILPKQQMIFYLNLFSAMASIDMNLMQIDSTSEVIINGNEKFCRVYYSGTTTMKISGKLLLKAIDTLKVKTEKLYGKENVEYDTAIKQFFINFNQSTIAIADKNTDEWKYIECTINNQEIIPKIIPVEVLKKLKL